MKRDNSQNKPVVGIALGSGSARGWSHIGVINALAAHGIDPDVVCGTSMGALAGAFYASGNLEKMEEWALNMTRKDILRFLDIKLLAGGGFIEGKRLMDNFREPLGNLEIESLPKRFAAVATELDTGHELWLRKGSLVDAVRASIALPGIFTPVRLDDKWLVDGGLVNPVPVSLCRAMGADIVIAVNLNGNIAGRHFRSISGPEKKKNGEPGAEATLMGRVSSDLRQRADSLIGRLFEGQTDTPGLFDVMAGSINIMQDRVTRSRMAGDPPDIILAPRLSHIGLLEFDRAKEAIEEGMKCVERSMPALQELL
ncbi:MAG: patatin-like phospholipase RssA [Proteobacteria bacterium]|nr:patatin-like phospholipase RssA [Pseudomonadota bacterium]